MAEHPITPPEATMLSLRNSAPHGILDSPVTRELWLINHAYAAGADQELEACCEWLCSSSGNYYADIAVKLRTARRPKPPTLKEQALDELDLIPTHDNEGRTLGADVSIIRRALEALPE